VICVRARAFGWQEGASGGVLFMFDNASVSGKKIKGDKVSVSIRSHVVYSAHTFDYSIGNWQDYCSLLDIKWSLWPHLVQPYCLDDQEAGFFMDKIRK
jgi:hypothetical protein